MHVDRSILTPGHSQVEAGRQRYCSDRRVMTVQNLDTFRSTRVLVRHQFPDYGGGVPAAGDAEHPLLVHTHAAHHPSVSAPRDFKQLVAKNPPKLWWNPGNIKVDFNLLHKTIMA